MPGVLLLSGVSWLWGAGGRLRGCQRGLQLSQDLTLGFLLQGIYSLQWEGHGALLVWYGSELLAALPPRSHQPTAAAWQLLWKAAMQP